MYSYQQCLMVIFYPLGFDSEKMPNVETFVISVEKESLGFLPAKSKI